MQEFIEKYRRLSDEKLYRLHGERETLTPEAISALEFVFAERGGKTEVSSKVEKAINEEADAKIVLVHARSLLVKGYPDDRVKTELLNLNYPPELIESGIAEARELIEAEAKDRRISFRTIAAGLPAALIGGTLAGFIWGLHMAQTGKMMVLFAIGVCLICYGFVKFFTRQSKENIAVWFMTLISIIYAFILGFAVYEWMSDSA